MSTFFRYVIDRSAMYIYSQTVSDKTAKIPSLTFIQGALSNQWSIVSPVRSLPYAEEPGGWWPADQGGRPPQLGHGGQVQEVPLVQPGPWLPPLHHHEDGSHEQQQHLHCLALCEELDFCLDCGFHKFRVISVALLIFYCLSTAAHKTVISGPGCDNTHLEPSFRFLFYSVFFTCSGTFCSSVVYGQTWMSLFERLSNCLTQLIDSTIIFSPDTSSVSRLFPTKKYNLTVVFASFFLSIGRWQFCNFARSVSSPSFPSVGRCSLTGGCTATEGIRRAVVE